MVVDVSQDVVDSQLRKLGFVRDEGDKRVFTKGSQVTTQGYLDRPCLYHGNIVCGCRQS